MERQDIKIGHTYSNGGKRKRLVVGFDFLYIYFKTSSKSKSTTGVLWSDFLKWAKEDITINE